MVSEPVGWNAYAHTPWPLAISLSVTREQGMLDAVQKAWVIMCPRGCHLSPVAQDVLMPLLFTDARKRIQGGSWMVDSADPLYV